MSDPEDLTPCARGCTWEAATEDEAPRPKPAKHGRLCNSCFYRIRSALNLVPDLMANMRAQLFSLGAADYSERVSGGGGESPAPLNLGPLDASDALFAKLAGWVAVFSEEFHTTPWPAIPAWSNDKEVQGSRIVSVEVATRRAAQMVNWLGDRLDRIARSQAAVSFHDDLCYGWDEARGVFSLSAAYGVKARPTREADKRECPLCGASEVFVKWADKLDPDVAVMCGRCMWVADPKATEKHLKAVANA